MTCLYSLPLLARPQRTYSTLTFQRDCHNWLIVASPDSCSVLMLVLYPPLVWFSQKLSIVQERWDPAKMDFLCSLDTVPQCPPGDMDTTVAHAQDMLRACNTPDRYKRRRPARAFARRDPARIPAPPMLMATVTVMRPPPLVGQPEVQT